MCNSEEMDAVAVSSTAKTLCYLKKRPPVDIEFQDLSYTVPQGRKGSKLILRSISGQFKSGQLTAILGPSGSGKSTLLNILAGYKCQGATGTILINGKTMEMKEFRRMSRYIMQDDLIQPMLTVQEAMMIAANLKLGQEMKTQDKEYAIDEILDLLNLTKTKCTRTDTLSGGERKRLSIALELLNNPPVIFLDEPTTGLDDLSCSQCISLLKKVADGGRTVICSIHTPSAKLFSVFDRAYIISSGQCVYQGYGPEVIQFLSNLGIECPTSFNPADFIIEISCGEYGDFQDKLVTAVDNGRLTFWTNSIKSNKIDSIYNSNIDIEESHKTLPGKKKYKHDQTSWIQQFTILLLRMWLQMWRDGNYLLLRTALHILMGFVVGSIYVGMGRDGSKTIFNFGFYFTCLIFFMYVPMMPVLVQFPREFQLIRREHFNKWYRLSAYFSALTCSTLPLQIILGSVYLMLVYLISDQPLEFQRMIMFFFVCLITGVISESIGLLIASQLSIVNAMFVGPVVLVPLILLAVYGFGSGYETIPMFIKIAMYFDYLRYALEGLIHSMLTNREKLKCPDSEDFCIYTDLKYFVREMGMENTIYWVDVLALLTMLVLLRGSSYYLIRQRLSPTKTYIALQYIGRLVKSHFNGQR